MKNNKLPTFPLWISLGVLAIISMPYIDKHSGFFQFLANLILVGVTAIYVVSTQSIVKYNAEQVAEIRKERELLEEQVNMLKKTVVIPQLTISIWSNELPKNIIITITNQSSTPILNIKFAYYIDLQKFPIKRRQYKFVKSKEVMHKDFIDPFSKLPETNATLAFSDEIDYSELFYDIAGEVYDDVVKTITKEDTGIIVLSYSDIFGGRHVVVRKLFSKPNSFGIINGELQTFSY